MPIKKKYLKTKPVCKVSFKIPAEIGINHKSAFILGTFNNWSKTADRMKKLVKDGSFSIVIDLEVGQDYEFKYLLDDSVWLNEENADGHITTHYGDSSNSVVSI